MRRFWILVPFWTFFVVYFVHSRDRRSEATAASGMTRDREVLRPVAASVPEQPPVPETPVGEARPPFVPAPAAPPGRTREALPSTLSDGELAAREQAISDQVFVLPREPASNPVSFLWPVDAEGSPDRPALLEVASRASFARWKLHEDEWVRFYYPDDPAVALEVLDGDGAVPMIGETMWTVEDAPLRRYRLATAEGATFCMVTVEESGNFDTTERFPKPEVFRRQLVEDGSLLRASLMSDGNLRRVELLAGGVRASVLDWPHCAVHRDVYERVALSVRLNGPVADGPTLAAALQGKAGLPERLGFLTKGMELSGVTAVLGTPAGGEEGVLLYEEAATVYRVPVVEGRFLGFAKGWKSRRKGPPLEHSLAWMLEKTGGTSGGEGAVGYDLGPLTPEETVAMFDRFCAEATTADGQGWDAWCRVLANLAEMQARDDRVAGVIGARFLDPGLPQANATQVLHAYDPEGSRDLFAARLEALLSGDPSASPVPGMAHDLQVLFAYLGKDDSRTAPLLDLAMRHAEGEIREAGYGFLDWLPAPRGLDFLEHGLADPNVAVRRRCAEALCECEVASAERVALVEQRLAAEADAETRFYLEEAKRRLSEGDADSTRTAAPAAPDAGASL